MTTIGGLLKSNRGIGPGFDTLRVSLAFAVILWHSYALCWGSIDAVKHSPAWAFGYAVLPVFFALSGFLVTGSALRLSLGRFAASRVLRIVPALVVDTLVTVLVLGPLLTTVPLAVYFSHGETARYLLNMVGEIHFVLPGLFVDNPLPRIVNGSLWTIPPELACYVVMAGLILFGWVRRWQVVAIGAFAFLAVVALAPLMPAAWHFPGKGFIQGPGMKLVPMFLLGSLSYLLADRIPYSRAVFAVAVALLVAAGFLADGLAMFTNPAWVVLSAPLLVYVMLFLGLTRLPRTPFFDRGDYSYGVYLYGFPIQQTLVQVFGLREPLVLFALAIPPVTLLAMFSWHVVEKPTLRLRKGFSFAARVQQQRKDEADAQATPSAPAPETALADGVALPRG